MEKIVFGPESLPDVKELEDVETVKIHVPQYHVILLDDDYHTYAYVIEMLMATFRHSPEDAYLMACEVDAAGWVIVDTTHKDRAELKRDQIHEYGPDYRIPGCKGGMTATVEPAWD